MSHFEIPFPIAIQFRNFVTRMPGRFGRRSFLAWNMLLTFLMIPFGILLNQLLPYYDRHSDNILSTLGIFLGFLLTILFLVYFTIVFTVKRLHDCSHSGWLALLGFVPIINLLFILYLIITPGEPFANQYGIPRSTYAWESVFAILYIAFLIFIVSSVLINLTEILSFIRSIL